MSLPRHQKWIFTILMLLLPLLILGGMEGLLRLVGYGHSYPLFQPVPGFPEYMYQNPEVARRYFGMQRNVPNSNFDVFRTVKDSSTIRIFVQGGSSAAGYPYYHGGTFSRMLEQRLQQTYPDYTFEVVNTAMAAVNSYTLLDLSDEILREHPDAILIYAGHNEFYGALGVGSAESVGKLRPIVLLYLKLRNFRLVQLLRQALFAIKRQLSSSGPSIKGHTLMSRIVRERQIPLYSPTYEMGLRQFKANLHDLLSRYARAGVPVFLGTVASNESDLPPFEGFSLQHPEAYRRLLQQAQSALQQGDTTAALQFIQQCQKMDSLAAWSYFLEGRIRMAQGRYEEAREAFLKARDRDMLRFRAPEAINRIIREEAEEHGAIVVPVEEHLRTHAPHGMIGHTLILEHLHPNLTGYFWMADAFYDALLHSGKLPLPWRPSIPDEEAYRERLVTPVDSLYGWYRVLVLTSDWPFRQTPPPVHPLDTLQARTLEARLARDLFQEKIKWVDAQEALRRHYEKTGNYREALRASMAILQEYPLIPEPYIATANILVKMHRYSEAITYYEAALDLREAVYPHQMLGALYLAMNLTQKARMHLQAALRMDPTNVQALYNMSGLYLKTGQPDSAAILLTRLLHIQPDHTEAQAILRRLRSHSY